MEVKWCTQYAMSDDIFICLELIRNDLQCRQMRAVSPTNIYLTLFIPG